MSAARISNVCGAARPAINGGKKYHGRLRARSSRCLNSGRTKIGGKIHHRAHLLDFIQNLGRALLSLRRAERDSTGITVYTSQSRDADLTTLATLARDSDALIFHGAGGSGGTFGARSLSEGDLGG